MTVSPAGSGTRACQVPNQPSPDDHVRMLFAEPAESWYLVRLVRRDPQCSSRQPGTETAHGTCPMKVMPVA